MPASKMLAKITNFGQPTTIPTCVGYYFIGRFEERIVDDPLLFEELEKFSQRSDSFLKIEIIEDERKIDYSKFTIQELKSIASRVGIKDFFTLKKSDLIKQLEV